MLSCILPILLCSDFIFSQFKIFSNSPCDFIFERWIIYKCVVWSPNIYQILRYSSITKIQFNSFVFRDHSLHDFNPLSFVETCFTAPHVVSPGECSACIFPVVVWNIQAGHGKCQFCPSLLPLPVSSTCFISYRQWSVKIPKYRWDLSIPPFSSIQCCIFWCEALSSGVDAFTTQWSLWNIPVFPGNTPCSKNLFVWH